MSALSNWWQTGDLGEVETVVSIDRKSIVILAVVTIATALIVLLMAKALRKTN